MRLLHRLLLNNSGATAIEYGLLAAIISLSLIAGVEVFSGSLSNTFGRVNTSIEGAGK